MSSLLLSLVVKGTVVLLLGAAAAVVLHRASASLRHGIWVATFVALLAVPALDALGPSWRVAIHSDAVSTPSVEGRGLLLEERVSEASVTRSVTPSPLVAPARLTRSDASRPTVMDWLARLWAAGALAVGVLWLRGFVLGRRLVRASTVVTDDAWSVRLRTATQKTGITGLVGLRRSDVLGVPVAWGWGRPTVVLPAHANAWSEECADAVLLHELAHLHRRDAWTQALAQAALMLHWPNPLAWVAYRRFLNTREQACDDAVLRVGAPPTAYASHLVAIARDLVGRRPALTSAIPLIGADELETRVRSILDRRQCRAPAGRRALGVTLALAVLVGGPLAAFQPVSRVVAHVPSAQPTTRDLSTATLSAPLVPTPPTDAPGKISQQPLDGSGRPLVVPAGVEQVAHSASDIADDLRPAEPSVAAVRPDTVEVTRSLMDLQTTARALDVTRSDLESVAREMDVTRRALERVRQRLEVGGSPRHDGSTHSSLTEPPTPPMAPAPPPTVPPPPAPPR